MTQDKPSGRSDTLLHQLYDDVRRRVARHEDRVARCLRIAAAAESLGLSSRGARGAASRHARCLVRTRVELAEILRALSDATTDLGVIVPLANELAQALLTKYRPRYTSPGRYRGDGRIHDQEHTRAQNRERKRRYDDALRAVDPSAIMLELDSASPGVCPDDFTWEEVAVEIMRDMQIVRCEEPSRGRTQQLKQLHKELGWLGITPEIAELE